MHVFWHVCVLLRVFACVYFCSVRLCVFSVYVCKLICFCLLVSARVGLCLRMFACVCICLRVLCIGEWLHLFAHVCAFAFCRVCSRVCLF